MQVLGSLVKLGRLALAYCRRLDWAGLGLFFGSLMVYVCTLAPGVLPSDYGEFQTKLYTMEPIHPPGYPLYLLIGRIWLSLVPFGSIAYRANLLSAVCAAAAVWFLYRFIHSLVRARVAAVVGAGLLAFSPLFWGYSIAANTYPLNTLLFIALLYTWLAAYDRRSSFLWIPFILGLGLAHHRLIAVSVPMLLVATLLSHRQLLRSARSWMLSVPVFLLPLGLYAVLVWQGVWPFESLVRHVLIGGGAVHSVRGAGPVLERLVEVVLPWLCQEYGFLLTLIGIGSLTALPWLPLSTNQLDRARQCHLALLLLGLLLTHLVFYALVLVEPDEPRYFVPVYVLVAAGIGVGLCYAQRQLNRWRSRAGRGVLAALLIPGLMVCRNFPEMMRRHDDYFGHVSRGALRAVEQDAVIVASWINAMPLYYYQAVEGWRQDVQILMPGSGVNREQAVAWIEAGQPLYFRQRSFGLDWSDSGYAWLDFPVGGLYRVLPDLPPIARWLPVSDVPLLHSLGLSAWPLLPDSLVDVRTTWEIEEPDGAILSVRLIDGDKQLWGQWARFLERLQTFRSADGMVQADLMFVVPPTAPPGKYTLELDLSRDEVLASVSIPEVPISTREHPISPQRLVVSDWIAESEIPSAHLQLAACDWPGKSFSENTVVTLPLFWQVVGNVSSKTMVSLHLVSGQERWSLLEPVPVFDAVTTEGLPTGTILESKHALAFAHIPPGRYRVEAEVQEGEATGSYDLGCIDVEARRRVYWMPSVSHSLHAVLGDEIELLGYDLEPMTGIPGGELGLTLYWRPLTEPTHNYKVFVHLMSAQNQLIVQRDRLPLGGVVLPRQWSPREILEDRYSLPIPPGLSEGEYRLEVGMYRSGSGERLPALDTRGKRWPHDKIVLQQVEISLP